MRKILKAVSYSFNRNIGWQDRLIRSILAIVALVGAIYFRDSNLALSIALGIFILAQIGTMLSARCIICYLSGVCTISDKERKKLDQKGIENEK